MAALVTAWPPAVGDAIARNAWPARLARDGTLNVATSSSAWAFELTQLEGDVRRRLRAALGNGAPVRLRFAPGPLPETSLEEPEEGAAAAPPVDAASRAEGERLAAAIGDEKLRKVVARAAAASLARAFSDRSF
ncbi:MAG: DUF721 domain-containing protein [Gaiellaceae bacterium]